MRKIKEFVWQTAETSDMTVWMKHMWLLWFLRDFVYFKVVPVSNTTTLFGLERDFSPVKKTYFSLYIEFCSNKYKNHTLSFYSSNFY